MDLIDEDDEDDVGDGGGGAAISLQPRTDIFMQKGLTKRNADYRRQTFEVRGR